MDLPLRLLREPIAEPVISVDGAWGAPGLNLSHWPGNATPRELKHDLSTGIALNFARLPRARRDELARGTVCVANNHYDTEGACSVFAVLRPEAALERERTLLDVAATGDFFQFPSEHAFAVSAIVEGVADRERSPWAGVAAIADERERHEAALHELVGRFPELLDGATEPYADLWKRELEALRADQTKVRAAARDDVVHLELCVWTAPRAPDGEFFDPSRHALFGSTSADRVLAIGPADSGWSYRLVISTLSWFDLVSPRTLPRPDLGALASALNALEGRGAADEHAWRFESEETPSPELWFGRSAHEMFADRSGALAPSALEPAVVRRAVADALRARWAFPE